MPNLPGRAKGTHHASIMQGIKTLTARQALTVHQAPFNEDPLL